MGQVFTFLFFFVYSLSCLFTAFHSHLSFFSITLSLVVFFHTLIFFSFIYFSLPFRHLYSIIDTALSLALWQNNPPPCQQPKQVLVTVAAITKLIYDLLLNMFLASLSFASPIVLMPSFKNKQWKRKRERKRGREIKRCNLKDVENFILR